MGVGSFVLVNSESQGKGPQSGSVNEFVEKSTGFKIINNLDNTVVLEEWSPGGTGVPCSTEGATSLAM
jgi:hypothetical protein